MRGGALCGAFIWDARFGKHFMLALTSAGDVCSCGAADSGVLGRTPMGLLALTSSGASGTVQADELMPRVVHGLSEVRACAIACGDSHCAALGCEGEVYTWGTASYGKLGHDDMTDLSVPTGATIRTAQHQAWRHHCHVTTLSCQRCQRLLMGQFTLVAPPPPPLIAVVQAMQGKRLVEIACSSHSTIARDDGGRLWSWGAHSMQAAPPSRVRMGGSICAIAAGGGHCAVALGEPRPQAVDIALAGTPAAPHLVTYALAIRRTCCQTYRCPLPDRLRACPIPILSHECFCR